MKIKYTIHGFQQTKLIENNLSNDDALILRVIKDSYSCTNFEYIIHENDKFVWISHSKLLEYIPIIGSRTTLERRLRHFVEIGLIEKVLKFDKNGIKGSYSYVKPTQKLDLLTEYETDTLCQNDTWGYVKMIQGVCQNDTGGMSKRHTKDSINIDSSNIDSINNSLSEKKSDKHENKNKNKKNDNFSKDSKEYKLSEYLLSKIKFNNSNFKIPDLNKWSRHVDLMIRIDNREEKDIEKVIDFCQKDQFWKSNILSTSKLREKFDQLFMKMNNINNQYNQKPVQSTNYTQREYDDEFFESCYTDLKQYKTI